MSGGKLYGPFSHTVPVLAVSSVAAAGADFFRILDTLLGTNDQRIGVNCVSKIKKQQKNKHSW